MNTRGLNRRPWDLDYSFAEATAADRPETGAPPQQWPRSNAATQKGTARSTQIIDFRPKDVRARFLCRVPTLPRIRSAKRECAAFPR